MERYWEKQNDLPKEATSANESSNEDENDVEEPQSHGNESGDDGEESEDSCTTWTDHSSSLCAPSSCATDSDDETPT